MWELQKNLWKQPSLNFKNQMLYYGDLLNLAEFLQATAFFFQFFSTEKESLTFLIEKETKNRLKVYAEHWEQLQFNPSSGIC